MKKSIVESASLAFWAKQSDRRFRNEKLDCPPAFTATRRRAGFVAEFTPASAGLLAKTVKIVFQHSARHVPFVCRAGKIRTSASNEMLILDDCYFTILPPFWTDPN
jgi:hypothetical protein